MEHGIALSREKRVDIDSGPGRDVAEALALDLVGQEDLPLSARQLLQRPRELFDQDFAGVDGVGTGDGGGKQVFEACGLTLAVQALDIGQAHSAFSAKQVDDPVAGDLEEPRSRPLDRLRQAIGLDELYEDLLAHVLDVEPGRQPRLQEASQPRAFALDSLCDPLVEPSGIGVAGQDSCLHAVKDERGPEILWARSGRVVRLPRGWGCWLQNKTSRMSRSAA